MADQSLLGYPTLIDIANNYSSTDANAMWIKPAQVLDRMCPLLKVLPMIETNNILSNVATRADYIPSPSFRRFNEGVTPTTGHNVPLNDPCALLEDYSEVDKEQCNIQNDPTAWRSDQDMKHMEGFRQTAENLFWYGNLAYNPGGFNGLSTRFNNLESYPNGDTSWQPNVWNNGTASGNCTSMWIIEFGREKVYGIYPKNTTAGLMVEDIGESTKEFATSTTGGPTLNKLMQVYRTHFRWFLGLQVNDERCVQRIANINPTALAAGNFDENVLIESKNQLPSMGEAPGTAIFVNRVIKTQIDIRAVSQKLNTYFTQDQLTGDVFGRAVTRFQGIPIFTSEKLLNTETVVS